MIPIDDDVAENMLKELGLGDDGEKMEAEETYSPGPGSRRHDEESPYQPKYEEERAVSTVGGDIQSRTRIKKARRGVTLPTKIRGGTCRVYCWRYSENPRSSWNIKLR